MSETQTVGDPCRICGQKVVEVSRETLQEILRNRPALKSISPREVRRRRPSYLLCPQCDAYALGIEMEHGYPFRDEHGETHTIGDYDLFN